MLILTYALCFVYNREFPRLQVLQQLQDSSTMEETIARMGKQQVKCIRTLSHVWLPTFVTQLFAKILKNMPMSFYAQHAFVGST